MAMAGRAAIIILLLIILIGTAIRLVLIGNQGFFEGDNFYYFAVMKETLANNGIIPNPLPLSGFPVHMPYQEFPGLIYATLIPYWLLLGIVPLIWVMYAMPVVFGMLGMVLAYLITMKLLSDRRMALVSAATFSFMPAAAFRDMALQYRGESFVPILLALFIYLQLSDRRPQRLASIALIPVMLIFWKGSVYIIPVILAALLMFAFERKPLFVRAALMAAISIAVLALSPTVFLLMEQSQNVLRGVGEVVPPSIGFAAMFLSITLVLAPVAWLYTLMRMPSAVKKRTHLGNIDARAWTWLTAILLVAVPLFMVQSRWIFLLAMPFAVFSAKGVGLTYDFAKARIRPINPMAMLLPIFLFLAMFAMQSYSINLNTAPLLEAGSWINQSTQSNSTFLTLWYEGSFIEGWGNRISYTESVNFNSSRAEDFSAFMLAKPGNYTYLQRIKPDYLLVDTRWAQSGIGPELEQYINITNSSRLNLNDTNFAHLIQDNFTGLRAVYNYNSIIIYNVTPLWQMQSK